MRQSVYSLFVTAGIVGRRGKNYDQTRFVPIREREWRADFGKNSLGRSRSPLCGNPPRLGLKANQKPTAGAPILSLRVLIRRSANRDPG